MLGDINKILIENMLKKAMKDVHSSPGRTVRNLIDLAANFSKGRFQQRFLSNIQTMLQNQNSRYYQLFTDTVSNVDMDLLVKFGMNLGYNGCTKGAKLIRKIEEEKGFNVPWSLLLNMNPEKLEREPEVYPEILRQSVELGIHTFFLGCRSGNPEKLIPLFESQPDCAFMIYLHGRQLTEKFLEKVKESKNVMISVYKDEDTEKACRTLREHRLLYAVHQRYTEENREEILNGSWIEGVLPFHPQFALLVSEPFCEEDTRKEVYQYVRGTREEQQYPVILMDIVSDAWMIDNVISEEGYVVGFERDGNVRTYNGTRAEKAYNIFEHNLEDILRAAAKKQNV